MDKKEKELREKMGAAFDKMKALRSNAETEKRALTSDEITQIDALYTEANELHAQAELLRKEREVSDKVNAKASEMPPLPGGSNPVAKSQKQIDFEVKKYTAQILTAAASKSMDYTAKMKLITEAQDALVAGGHYKMEAEGFNTLVDSDGGIFLPTTVSDMVFDISREYGVFARYALRFPTGGGRLKIPNVMGELEFQAVNETSDILVDQFTFKGLELDDLKWGLFIPWSNEVEGVRGAQLVGIIIQKLGEALSRKIDEVVINANGTSTYHNIKGLIDRAGDAAATWVRTSTAITTHDSFAELTYADWANAQLDVAPRLRGRGVYVSHPNMRVELMKQAVDPDNANGNPWVTISSENMFVYGRPIYFTEAFPNTDGATKAYAAFVDPSYVAIADSGAFTTELFSEATIKTSSGGTINLASQDMKALRVKAFFDVELSPVTVTDGATPKGAFTVMYTAAN